MVTANPILQLVLDLVGVFAFALSGALVGLRQRLDIFGVVVLSVGAGLGGGLLRDLLLGDTPPPALADGRYVGVAVLAGLLAFALHGRLARLAGSVRVRLGTALQALDAAGLGVFTVAGTSKALAFGLGPIGALVLGVLTGVGGGVIRDILAGQVPVVLQRELYAVPALAGSVVVVVAARAGWYGPVVAAGAAAFVFGFRILAVTRDWHAPRPSESR